MKILGLDSSGLVAGVAVVENGILLAEYNINYKKTHSQTLLPMLEELRNRIELDLESLDGIAISAGPGSFTGLRIGAATAKGLGLALDKPLIEVPTLEGLAYHFWGSESLVCPMMDARRNQVYTGIYEFVLTKLGTAKERLLKPEAILPQCAMDIEMLMCKINELGRKVIFLGDGVSVYQEDISSRCQTPFLIAPAHLNRQRAANVAALGEIYIGEGRIVSAAAHQPEYLRKSQAEREREEAEKDKEGQESEGAAN
ncbi:MAG: tRNA (adenosine(37)-N6)-threonylcarbamoyltransferase complex dimerization subunit type 1 TsaB [Roseburia sp.]|nr:tRNA (adenosine(37)-N6)-threonylcarbamoyltransferase complex dimerization subunit type 1 TsaB [Roseburia sp.]